MRSPRHYLSHLSVTCPRVGLWKMLPLFGLPGNKAQFCNTVSPSVESGSSPKDGKNAATLFMISRKVSSVHMAWNMLKKNLSYRLLKLKISHSGRHTRAGPSAIAVASWSPESSSLPSENEQLLHSTACKCSRGIYQVPNTDDVPLLLCTLTVEDQRVLSPFEVHCGQYRRIFNGYRQRTGPFRVSWCTSIVREKIEDIADENRRDRLLNAYEYLLHNADSSYSNFIAMQLRRERKPFLYEIYSSPRYRAVECAIWPALYFRTSLCETVLEGQSNRASGKMSFIHKLLSPVVDYAMHYELVQYHYDRWLFKTITGAVNASKASGCSPNRSLENKSFSKTFWEHQHLFLIDAVHQYGFPSLFLTISPYEWTFPFPPFIEDMRNTYGKDVTELAALETLHIAHVLEQVVRGYVTGGNCNRWRTHLFSNVNDPSSKNIHTFFYRFEFQQRGTVHLHMLVWLKELSSIRGDLLHASIPWENAQDTFLVADTQKSDKSCLPVNNGNDSFITDGQGKTTLQFRYTEEDAQRNIRAYVTTLLGSLRCRTDMQVADGKAMLLKHVSSYVTKMHESATSEGLYCHDITGYQAANSFLRTVIPLEPEMVLQLSNIKVCWTDKVTVLFRPPFPHQTTSNKVYNMYLKRSAAEDDQSLLQWLRCHQTSTSKQKAYGEDRVLVGVKYVSVFNPVFFYQHLTMHYPHRTVDTLHHAQSSTMPSTIAYFAQSAALMPDSWNTSDTVLFLREGRTQRLLYQYNCVLRPFPIQSPLSLANWCCLWKHKRCLFPLY